MTEGDIEAAIRQFAKDHDMTYFRALQYLGKRPTTQCAAELIGIWLPNHPGLAKNHLWKVWKFFFWRGFTFEKLQEMGVQQYVTMGSE